MRPTKEFALSVTISAPVDQVWEQMVDWEGQSEWMLSTRVYDEPHSPEGVGHRLRAFTGPLARWNRIIGVMDEMVVSEWDPPHFCRVEHIGRIIRGYGTFTLTRRQIYIDGIKEFTHFAWFEEIDAPKWILRLIKPGILIGVWISLMRFKRRVEKS
ncbi:MAG: SRPBCC family protein [Candidatus Nanopelagicaceae bacterium]